MKKFLHSLTRWFLSLLLVVASISEMVVPTLADDNISGNIYVLTNPIPYDAKDYALSIAESHITTFLKMNSSYRNECTEDVDTYLGDGYYVYRESEGILYQGDIIDFPVIQNGQVVLIIHVTYTEDGWRSTASYAYSDELNQYIHTGITCRIIAYDEYSDCNVVPVNITPTNGAATRAADQYMVDTIPSDLYLRSDCKLGRMYGDDPANKPGAAGRKYNSLFNPQVYYNNYPDLQEAIGTEPEALYRHFEQCGVNEGRVASNEFNVRQYRANYADLQEAFGLNWKAYFDHYLAFGKAEHRDAATVDDAQTKPAASAGLEPIFNASYYLNKYPDLMAAFGNDEARALQHFLAYGMEEGRQGCGEFSVGAYQARYTDLQKAFGNNLPAYYYHYINLGRAEKRVAN